MHEIVATYRIVTPMFLGGANQTPDNGIRPPSVKGALRFWWRALNWAKFRNTASCDETALMLLHNEEARLFGIAADNAGGGGQGCFLLRVTHGPVVSTSKGAAHSGFRQKDAARYLGYGLMVAFGRDNGPTPSGQLYRACLNENQEFTVTLVFRHRIEASVQETLIAWGLLGGLGSRARHGIGSVALISLKLNGAVQSTAPIDAENYVAQIKALFPSPIPPSTTKPLPAIEPPFSAFWEKSRIDILLVSDVDCYAVLDDFGKAMLMYRSWGQTSRGNVLPGGGTSEKRFKADHDWSKGTGPKGFHPERVVFGLPHNYGQPDRQKVNAERHQRRSSPLLFHVHPIDNTFVGVGVYLPAQFLPDCERINAGGNMVPEKIDWPVITNFLDGTVGNPSPPGAAARFPGKTAVLP